MPRSRSLFAAVAAASVLIAGCSTDSTGSGATDTTVAAAASPELLSVDEFAVAIENPEVVTINVHVPDEGDLPGTDLSIPFNQIERSEELPTDLDTPLAVYCRSGTMSEDAVRDLDSLGYTNVVELNGGFNAWVASGETLLEPPP